MHALFSAGVRGCELFCCIQSVTDGENSKCAGVVADAEQRLDKLIAEKDMVMTKHAGIPGSTLIAVSLQLESTLRRASRAKSIREVRQTQVQRETSLVLGRRSVLAPGQTRFCKDVSSSCMLHWGGGGGVDFFSLTLPPIVLCSGTSKPCSDSRPQ